MNGMCGKMITTPMYFSAEYFLPVCVCRHKSYSLECTYPPWSVSVWIPWRRIRDAFYPKIAKPISYQIEKGKTIAFYPENNRKFGKFTRIVNKTKQQTRNFLADDRHPWVLPLVVISEWGKISAATKTTTTTCTGYMSWLHQKPNIR